jgi:hypothetical protein
MKASVLVPATVPLFLTAVAVAQSRLGIVEPDKPFPRLQLPLLGSDRLVAANELFRDKKTVLLIFASW